MGGFELNGWENYENQNEVDLYFGVFSFCFIIKLQQGDWKFENGG